MTVNSTTKTTITLTWTPADTLHTSFEVYRNGISIATVIDGSNTFLDTGLTANTEYTYIIRAINDDGFNDSLPLPATTDPLTPPGVPTLSQTNITYNSIELSISTLDNLHTSFILLRDNVVIESNLSASTTTYTDTNLSPSTQYIYILRAVNTDGSTDSNLLTLTTNPIPVPG